MLIACQAFSQVATPKDSVKIPFHVAMKINLDLLDYDRLRDSKVEDNLNKCLLLILKKDSVKSLYEEKIRSMLNEMKAAERQVYTLKDKLEYSEKKRKKGWIWLLIGVAAGGTTAAILSN